MDLQHIVVKVFAKSVVEVEAAALIEIFHGWIRRSALDDLKTIDVADYSHVHQGPGVMLICQEGHIGLDHVNGNPGLVYANKRLATGDIALRLRTAVQRAVRAASFLEGEALIKGRLSFAYDRMMFRFDDRLDTPNTPEAFEAMKHHLVEALSATYDSDQLTLRHVEDPKTGLTVEARLPPDTKSLLV